MATDNQMTANGQPLGAATGATPAPVPPADVRRRGDGESVGTPKPGTPKHGTPKGGAPAHNGNRLVHGLYSSPEQTSWRLVMGTLPRMLAGTEDDTYSYRGFLEAAVVEQHGAISRTAAHHVYVATKWYRHGLICQKLMRDTEGDGKLTAGQKRDAIERLSEKTCKAAEAIIKAVVALKIDVDTQSDPWAAYDAHMARQRSIAAQVDLSATSPNNASNAAVDVQHDGGAN